MLKPLLMGSSLIFGSMLLATPAESRSVVLRRVVVNDRTPNVIVIHKNSDWHPGYLRGHGNYQRFNPGLNYGIPIGGSGASVVISPWGNPYPIHSPGVQPWHQPYGGYGHSSVLQPHFNTPVRGYPSRYPQRRVRGSVTISF